jgi:hypothetical protein
MSFAAALILAAGPAVPPPATMPPAIAQVAVTILQPVAVRQGHGVVESEALPIYQLSRRDGVVLVEFQ